MREVPVPLSGARLRFAGHVGQITLDRMKNASAARVAQFDQHVAEVRAGLAGSQQPSAAAARRAGLTAGRMARWPAGPAAPAVGTAAICPDVPFAGSALHAETALPLEHLLHYACGFTESAVSSGWQPSESRRGSDWKSMRLAATCHLISLAEAAAELPPDLRALS